MLGSLCRWLRFFGFDAEFSGVEAPDEEILAQAETEQRWLLTRDRHMASYGPRTMLIRSVKLEDQLVEVLSRLDLLPVPNLDASRCGDCNGRLEDIARNEVEPLVPPYVFLTAKRFRRCDACGRVYWPGTHGRKITRRLERVMERVRGEA